MRKINDLLNEAIEAVASDVHLAVGRPPVFRIYAELKPVGDQALAPEETEQLVTELFNGSEELKQRFIDNHQVDFSYAMPDGHRFRVNVFQRLGTVAAALRVVKNEIPSIQELNLPPQILQFAEQKQGFVLAAGPTGHGKSTTLAMLTNHVNTYRDEHIITIEDPIEFQFTEKKSIIDQREIGHDAVSFAQAIRATLRQDPDVILIGELRDRESMQTALTLAETGHLVLSTIHTNDAAQTVQRIIDSFPASQQATIRSQLANALSGVISQRLVPRLSGGRIPAVEILTASPAIRNAIREDKVHQILGIMQTSGDLGMQTLSASLRSLVEAGEVDSEEARLYMTDGSLAPVIKERK